ncbi:MAG: ATP-NAD kinase family protein, partial [Ardenticatenaceae bacterium]
MATVGIIANPAAGKDIRRLVAQGRFIPNQEKVNVLKRVLAGLDAVEVERVVFMPDSAMLGRGAIDGMSLNLEVEFLEMTVFNEDNDSTRAARLLAQMGIGCLITLGGDGTNRAVAKGSGGVPLVPVSTGTNNVFPSMVEGTLAGLAAGLIARDLVDLSKAATVSKRLEIYVNDALADIALVDLAISKERFVGARAIWDMETIHEVFLTRAEPASIGLSSIGAQLQPVSMSDEQGIYLKIGAGGPVVTAPVAPGMVIPVELEEWHVIEIGEKIEVRLKLCTIALDGERTFTVLPSHEAFVTLSMDGPPVVSVEAALREAAIKGVF